MPIAHRDYENEAADCNAYVIPASISSRVTKDHSESSALCLDNMHEATSDSWPKGGPTRNNVRSESRADLIDRIKKSSPNWIQTNLTSHIKATQDLMYPDMTLPTPEPLLPAAQITGRPRSPATIGESSGLEDPSGIERPRSALHSGDFRQESPQRHIERSLAYSPPHRHSHREWLSTSPTTPWYIPSASIHHSHNDISIVSPAFRPSDPIAVQARSRPISQSSLSSSFAFRPPTSPLAQHENTADFEIKNARLRLGSPERHTRRHTFTQHSIQDFRMCSDQVAPLSSERQSNSLRREGTYQAHQPRRSIGSFQSSLSYSTPQSSFLHGRRPSIPSELSPIQRAPLVGPYEESILRGRMSTLPSRPLDFVAQIGVLGKGHCKPNLRCPPHLSIPFPAVFYSYGDARPRYSIMEDGPSPYVGLIDLENAAKLDEPVDHFLDGNELPHASEIFDFTGHIAAEDDASLSSPSGRRKKRKDRGTMLKKAPRGSYRIPQQGQLQIVIKNPNKTAVKLFLVPYDLTGMDAGHKTFIRQRSYSAGPIIDMPLSSRTNFGTDRPEAALSSSDNPADRPVLRYLIHLNICSPSNGRYYLYKSIRVVFANRVPDSKEKLRNEIQLPEPRYSAYRPEQRLSREPSDWR